MKFELEIVKFNTVDVITASTTAPGACGDTDNNINTGCGGPLD